MAGPDDGDRFGLVVPPDPRHVSTARIFAAAVARVLGADEDTVEDLKVAISEACSMSLRGAGRDEPLEIDVVSSDDRLRFEVRGAVPAGWPDRESNGTDTPTPTAIAATLSREVLSALFDDAAVERTDDRGRIRFSVVVGTSD